MLILLLLRELNALSTRNGLSGSNYPVTSIHSIRYCFLAALRAKSGYRETNQPKKSVLRERINIVMATVTSNLRNVLTIGNGQVVNARKPSARALPVVYSVEPGLALLDTTATGTKAKDLETK